MELKTPLGWSIKKIKDIGKCVTGTTPRTNEPEYYSSFDYDFISPADLGNSKYIYNSNKKISQKGIEVSRPIPKNTVLCVCIGSSIGKVGLSWHKKSCSNQQINSIICNKFNNSHFIYYLLLYYSDYWKSFATFSTVPILNKGRFEEIKLPTCNDIEEQQKIARVLTMVQDAIAQQEQLITLTTELKKSLMHKLFTKGTCKEPQRKTDIGLIPDSWDISSIDRHCDSCAFGPRFSSKEYQLGGEIVTLRTTDMDDDGNIDYTKAPLATLNKNRFGKHFLKIGDIVVSRSGTCGIASVFTGNNNPVLPGAFLIRLRMKQSIIPQFLRHYINSPVGRPRILQLAEGAIQKNISGTRLKNIIIPIPNIHEQKQIANNIDLVEEKIGSHRRKNQALKCLFKTLLHQLMTAQIRVDDLDISALNLEPQRGDE